MNSYLLDLIFADIDNKMWDGKYKEINQILDQVKPDELLMDVLLGFLTITLPIAKRCPARQKIADLIKDIDDDPKLLIGLIE